MKISERLIALHEAKLDKDDLEAVEMEVVDSFSTKEVKDFKNFKEFFAEVDVQQGYEEEWNPRKWKPYYEDIYNRIINNKLKCTE